MSTLRRVSGILFVSLHLSLFSLHLFTFTFCQYAYMHTLKMWMETHTMTKASREFMFNWSGPALLAIIRSHQSIFVQQHFASCIVYTDTVVITAQSGAFKLSFKNHYDYYVFASSGI